MNFVHLEQISLGCMIYKKQNFIYPVLGSGSTP